MLDGFADKLSPDLLTCHKMFMHRRWYLSRSYHSIETRAQAMACPLSLAQIMKCSMFRDTASSPSLPSVFKSEMSIGSGTDSLSEPIIIVSTGLH